MHRPCFLVIDREYAGGISTRKLVIETAKFNVITAYSGAEALLTFSRFPAVNGIVLDAGTRDVPSSDLVRKLKQMGPGVPVIAVGRPGAEWIEEADHYVESFDPRRILELLQRLEPDQTAAIEKQNEELSER